MRRSRESPTTPANRSAPREKLVPNPSATLREQVREVMRFRHYSPRTEVAYWQWAERFLRFHKRAEVGGAGGLAASARIGRIGGDGVPEPPGGGAGGVGFHPKSGVERTGVSVWGGAAPAAGGVGRVCASAPTASVARGDDARGNAPGARGGGCGLPVVSPFFARIHSSTLPTRVITVSRCRVSMYCSRSERRSTFRSITQRN